MHTVLYDGSFGSFLSAVFDVYEYKFDDVQIRRRESFKGNIFGLVHETQDNREKAERVYKGLQKKLSEDALKDFYQAFLSEIEGIEDSLLLFARYVFASNAAVEKDFSNEAVLQISQVSRKVWREKHRMEAFVRFKKTGDGLFYSLIEPDYNVLPLIASHFKARYADQCWLIYDGKRGYGIHYDKKIVTEVKVDFNDLSSSEASVYDEKEEIFQQLWQQYFKSVNIIARKNTRLHLHHMPRRYWKHLVEKQERR